MKKLLLTAIVAAIVIGLFLPMSTAHAIDPQYIFVRKDATCSNCYNWNGYDPDQINMEAVNEIFNGIGTKGTDNRKVGVGVLFYYNQIPMDNLKASLQRLLDYALIHDFPVYIALDGFQWWDNRSDLWNFWNPDTAGYNPDNTQNVEWTCDNPSCAITGSWRNWGAELETIPHPNLASRAFIDTNKQSLSQLLPIIVNWYTALPSDKKWLLGGVSTGTEVDIGGNYYYPGGGIAGSQQLGFAAIHTLDLTGGITTDNLNEIVKRYINELDKVAIDAGIPKSKIFNHVGGSDLLPKFNNLTYQTAMAAITEYGSPGWSFYNDVTQNPQNYNGLTTALDQINNGEWASPEWLTSATDYDGWVTALLTSLRYRNNRFINIANWEGIKNKQYALDAVKAVANEVFERDSSEPTALPTPAPKTGDINNDGHVNTLDFDLVVAGYGITYTIFDYNALVTNFEK